MELSSDFGVICLKYFKHYYFEYTFLYLIEQGVRRGELQYVPATCCVFTEKYNQYLNVKTCQTASHMAPGSDTDVGNNPAMYYTVSYY